MASKKPAAPAAKPAAKPASKVPAIMKPKTTAVALPFMDRLKQQAVAGRQQAAKVQDSSASVLSFRNARISLDKRDLGTELPVVIVAQQFERSYFASDYDPNRTTPPDCYSRDNETPHPDASAPQSDACANCPMNQWNTDKRGKGKACREGITWALLAADPKVMNPESIATGQIVKAKFSVLNSKDAKVYTELLNEKYEVGPPAVVTMLKVQPDSTRQILNSFEIVDEVDEACLEAIAGRLDEAETFLNQPYPKAEAAPPVRGPAPRATARKY